MDVLDEKFYRPRRSEKRHKEKPNKKSDPTAPLVVQRKRNQQHKMNEQTRHIQRTIKTTLSVEDFRIYCAGCSEILPEVCTCHRPRLRYVWTESDDEYWLHE